MTIAELKAKIETLDDVAKVLSDCEDTWGNIDPSDAADEIESMRCRLVAELRRVQSTGKPCQASPKTAALCVQGACACHVRQLHADVETVVGRS